MRQYITNGSIGLDPYDDKMIQPASLDMRLGENFLIMDHGGHIDTRDVQLHTHEVPCRFGEPFILDPGMFALAQTWETISLPSNIAAKLEGKSSLGRLGLLLHATAGFIDPGFTGSITLELTVCSRRSLVLYPGMKIGQLAFFSLSSPALVPYGDPSLASRYQGQSGPTASRYTG